MKEISLKENINCIREVAPNRYRIILDFATTKILKHLIQESHKYVWVHDHTTGNGFEWQHYNVPVKEGLKNLNVLAKGLNFDFIIPTDEFKLIMGEWSGGIQLIQINKIPPHYLDLKRIKGHKRYEILKTECDYLFEVDIPSAKDYGTLISPKREYLQSLLDNKEINWVNLP